MERGAEVLLVWSAARVTTDSKTVAVTALARAR
jgi:hypothetical protein